MEKQSNGLIPNASKTEFIVFSKTRWTTNTHMFVDNVVIDEKEAIKYLGVHIDRLLTFQEDTKHILKKRQQVLRLFIQKEEQFHTIWKNSFTTH